MEQLSASLSEITWSPLALPLDAVVSKFRLPTLVRLAHDVFKWWTLVRPYYTKAYQEMWVGVGIMSYLYYKVSYGGTKAVKDKPAH